MTRSKSFILTLSVQVIFYALNLVHKWPLLRFSGVSRENFAIDLVATLNLADCGGKTCSDFIYGEMLAVFIRTFSMEQWNIYFLANSLILLFFICVAFMAHNSTNLNDVIMLNLVCLSPAVALLLERANIDLLVFILVFFSGFLLKRKNYIWCWFILLFTSLIKFYTVVPFVLVSFLFQAQKSRRCKILICFASVVSIVLVLIDVLTKANSFPIYWSEAFGAGIWLPWIAEILREFFGLVIRVSSAQIFAASLATMLGIATLARKYSRYRPLYFKISSDIDLLLMTGLGCYFLGISFDYRLVYVLLPLTIISTQPKLFFRVLIVISAYFTTTNYGLDFRFAYPTIQILGDFSLLVLVFSTIFAWNPNSFEIDEWGNRIRAL